MLPRPAPLRRLSRSADLLAVVLAVAAASADVAAHHTNYTLNNLIACLIATDILQVREGDPPAPFFSGVCWEVQPRGIGARPSAMAM